MSKQVFSGIFFLIFLTLTSVMAGLYLSQTLARQPAATLDDVIKGHWGSMFEKSLGEILPAFAPSRNFWGQTDYTLFSQGRKGVVMGTAGWLFSDEEFSCTPDAASNLQANFNFIASTRDMLATRKIRLAVILVPAKSRVYSENTGSHVLPPCRAGLYDRAVTALTGEHVPVVDLLKPMLAAPDKKALYLRTDTHWSPVGARFAAETAAAQIDISNLAKKEFTTFFASPISHSGDLLRYVPGVRNDMIHPEPLAQATTSANGESDLFGDATPPITLVGTSYSANPLWNFDGFLKQALHVDILNMVDQGLGPFTVMDKYLASPGWQNTPPGLLIWEIPERYLVFPHKISNTP